MKSAQISSYGDPSLVQITQTEKPTIKSGEVLVEVHAASINPIDNMILKGYAKEMIPLTLPATLGGDIAGIVKEIAEDVTEFAVGDRVFGQSMAPSGSGAFAEYAAAPSNRLALVPEGVSFEQAASLPLAGVSALQALKTIGLESGKKIFINGGSGGIGSIAIQIAKAAGCYVAATASTEHTAAVKEIGADEVIDYKSENFADKLSGYDAILDTAGADFKAMVSILNKGGVIVSLTGSANEEEGEELGVKANNQFTQVTHDMLEELIGYVSAGTLVPQIGTELELDNVSEAFETLEHGSTFGKIVVRISK